MAPLRIEIVDLAYHVNGKAVDGAKLFRHDDDRLLFLKLLAAQARRSNWCILSYALMTTHYHVVLVLRDLTLSSGFRRFNSVYARTFNDRYGRRGALWQRRFWDSMIETDAHLYEALRYVALNPTRAGLCARPEDWPWSSYAAAIGLAPPDPVVDEQALLRLFDTRPETARALFQAVVEEVDPRVRRGQTLV